MEERERIDAFLAEKELAVAGVSRGGNKFGNTIYRELRQRGYTVHPINPHAAEVEGTRCYASVAELPQGTGGVIAVVPPEQTPELLNQLAAAGIGKVWMQPGSQSQAALDVCRTRNIEAVSGRCILMFTEPVASIHKLHRFFARLFGSYPKRTT